MIATTVWYSILRDEAGRDEEPWEIHGETAGHLYIRASARHSFSLPLERLRVAVNDAFTDMDHPLRDGDKVVFIAPVGGG
jgi:molybdopterin converting factor small subunit